MRRQLHSQDCCSFSRWSTLSDNQPLMFPHSTRPSLRVVSVSFVDSQLSNNLRFPRTPPPPLGTTLFQRISRCHLIWINHFEFHSVASRGGETCAALTLPPPPPLLNIVVHSVPFFYWGRLSISSDCWGSTSGAAGAESRMSVTQNANFGDGPVIVNREISLSHCVIELIYWYIFLRTTLSRGLRPIGLCLSISLSVLVMYHYVLHVYLKLWIVHHHSSQWGRVRESSEQDYIIW